MRYSLYWLAWATVGWLVPEGIALATNPANTLSDNTWRLIGLAHGWPWSFAHLAIAVGLAGLLFWSLDFLTRAYGKRAR